MTVSPDVNPSDVNSPDADLADAFARDPALMLRARAIGKTFFDADGVPLRFDGITIDVTDRGRWTTPDGS